MSSAGCEAPAGTGGGEGTARDGGRGDNGGVAAEGAGGAATPGAAPGEAPGARGVAVPVLGGGDSLGWVTATATAPGIRCWRLLSRVSPRAFGAAAALKTQMSPLPARGAAAPPPMGGGNRWLRSPLPGAPANGSAARREGAWPARCRRGPGAAAGAERGGGGGGGPAGESRLLPAPAPAPPWVPPRSPLPAPAPPFPPWFPPRFPPPPPRHRPPRARCVPVQPPPYRGSLPWLPFLKLRCGSRCRCRCCGAPPSRRSPRCRCSARFAAFPPVGFSGCTPRFPRPFPPRCLRFPRGGGVLGCAAPAPVPKPGPSPRISRGSPRAPR